MSKKKKKEKDEEVKKPKAIKKAPAPAAVEPAVKPKTRVKPKVASKTASTPRKPKAVSPGPKIGFSTEEIALRAYFIAEDRHRHGKPGSESGDWHEAERQLRAEALARTSGK